MDGPYPETKEFLVIPYSAASPDFAFYSSLYREARNSNSEVYEFLCLFRLLEGLFARRARLDQQLVRRGETPTRFRERLPSDVNEMIAFLTPLFRHVKWNQGIARQIFVRKVAGKRIKTVFEVEMRTLRNRVAHSVLKDGEPSG